jgi:hypothetical protein
VGSVYGRFIWQDVGVLATKAGIAFTSWKLKPVFSTL